MDNDELLKLADELFYIFTLVNPECDKGEHLSAHTNQILAFEKYAQHMDWQIVHKYCHKFEQSDMDNLQKIISIMVSRYLFDNVKTLAIY